MITNRLPVELAAEAGAGRPSKDAENLGGLQSQGGGYAAGAVGQSAALEGDGRHAGRRE